MAVMSWRGLDGMQRAQTRMHLHSDEVLALQAALGQWGADLDAVVVQPDVASLDWDGRALRIVRRDTSASGQGLYVAAWSSRNMDGKVQWLRWQSETFTNRGDLLSAWERAGQWAQNAGTEDRKREVRTVPIDRWQVFFYRGDAWVNPLSSAGPAAPSATTTATLPEAVRLVLTLPEGQAISGTLTRDWVTPTLGGRK
jgi:general secretion pathway protein J